jgi:Domain of unknown function (DUF4296)
MKKVFLAILVIPMVLCACSDVDVTARVLNQDEMANVLNDIALAEGFVESYLYKDSTLNKDSATQAEVDKALQLRKVGTDLFVRSYRYYQSNPDLFKIVVDTANARASRNRDKSYSRRVLNPS